MFLIDIKTTKKDICSKHCVEAGPCDSILSRVSRPADKTKLEPADKRGGPSIGDVAALTTRCRSARLLLFIILRAAAARLASLVHCPHCFMLECLLTAR